MRILANIVSYIFHPLFVLAYILGLLMVINPYVFKVQDEKAKVIFLVYTLVSLIVIPIIAILILKQVDIIKSFKMEGRMERVGPLLVVGVLYLWLYINYKNTSSVPVVFSSILLGSVISVFVSFFINNFTKISLHTVGMGGLVSAMLIIRFGLKYGSLDISVFNFGDFHINTYLLVLTSIVLAGLVGTVRLYLNAHSKDQVYLGYIVGALSQLIAYNIVF